MAFTRCFRRTVASTPAVEKVRALDLTLKRQKKTLCHFLQGVYCGHTCHSGTAHVLPNLTVFTGVAEHATPQVNGVIDVE